MSKHIGQITTLLLLPVRNVSSSLFDDLKMSFELFDKLDISTELFDNLNVPCLELFDDFKISTLELFDDLEISSLEYFIEFSVSKFKLFDDLNISTHDSKSALLVWFESDDDLEFMIEEYVLLDDSLWLPTEGVFCRLVVVTWLPSRDG